MAGWSIADVAVHGSRSLAVGLWERDQFSGHPRLANLNVPGDIMRGPTPSKPMLHMLVPLLAAATFACTQSGDTGADTTATAADTTAVAGISADWRGDAPGVRHRLTPADLPEAVMQGTDAEASVTEVAEVVAPPDGAMPRVPDGFTVSVFARDLKQPRRIRVAPNGDIFVSESGAGRVLVYQPSDTGMAAQPGVFAEDLDRPYGIAFVPSADPQWVCVAAANQVVRYPYHAGARQADGPAEVIVRDLPTSRHWTKDLVASPDGSRIFLAVGSASNLGMATMPEMPSDQIAEFEKTHGRGAAWGEEENRAVVRVFDQKGGELRNYATGLRNRSGLAVQPASGDVWCVVNERGHLGPNLVPDFMTRLQDGAFYGWPWYYAGDHEDPARAGQRPDLEGDVRTPDVLFQAHSSALGVAFYDGDAFPAEYRGDAFVTLHGSHSRPERTGYKVVRVRMDNGQATGEYDDFMTGFVLDNERVWGRPAGVAVTRDGALLVSDDANGVVYRVSGG